MSFLSDKWIVKKHVFGYLGPQCIATNIQKNVCLLNPLSTNPMKWSNTLKQFICNSLRVFDHFVGLVFNELT